MTDKPGDGHVSASVTITAAISAAINATLGLLLFLGVSADVVAALQVSAAAWIVVGAMIVHRRTVPLAEVALTRDQVVALTGASPDLAGPIDLNAHIEGTLTPSEGTTP